MLLDTFVNYILTLFYDTELDISIFFDKVLLRRKQKIIHKFQNSFNIISNHSYRSEVFLGPVPATSIPELGPVEELVQPMLEDVESHISPILIGTVHCLKFFCHSIRQRLQDISRSYSAILIFHT